MEPALLTTSTSTQALLLCAFGTTVLIALFLGGLGRRGTSSIVSFFWGDSDLKSSETGITSNNILAHLVSMLAGNPLVFVVVIMGFFALMLSTVDGFLLASAQALVWDIIHKRDVQRMLA